MRQSGHLMRKRARATIGDIGWLTGSWKARLGNASLEECWTPAAGGAMLGLSRTVAGNKMVVFEFLQIIEHHGGLVYLSQTNGRAPATEFTLTRLSAAGAVFENRFEDVPKLIKYSLEADGTLTAVIADFAGLKPQRISFRRSP
jgi:Domain of unknown function (DUF6265)